MSALEAVGATRAAAALRAAIAKFPGGTPPTERRLRYPGDWQQVLGLLGSLDVDYYQEQPDVFSRLCSFIESHKADFRAHEPEAKPGTPADGGNMILRRTP